MNGGQTRERGKIKSKGNEGEGWAGKVGGDTRRMNESHDSHVFCFAYSVHRLIRHALPDTCTVSHSCREKRDAVSWTVRSPPAVIIATRFRSRFRSHARCRMERKTDENARDARIITGRDPENRNDAITILTRMKKIGDGSRCTW